MSHVDVTWQEFALCARVDPELFHPTQGGPEIRPARRICHLCEVRLNCVNFAIREGIRQGIWGGFSGQQLAEFIRVGTPLETLPDYTDKRKEKGFKKKSPEHLTGDKSAA